MSQNSHHITPISVYLRTLVILAVLMGLTILVYEIDFGHIISSKAGLSSAAGSYINNFIALTIAIIKATYVVLYFMGVKYTTGLVKLYAAAGFVWVTLMGITFCDYFTRSWEPIQGWNPGDTNVVERKSVLNEQIRGPRTEPVPSH